MSQRVSTANWSWSPLSAVRSKEIGDVNSCSQRKHQKETAEDEIATAKWFFMFIISRLILQARRGSSPRDWDGI